MTHLQNQEPRESFGAMPLYARGALAAATGALLLTSCSSGESSPNTNESRLSTEEQAVVATLDAARQQLESLEEPVTVLAQPLQVTHLAQQRSEALTAIYDTAGSYESFTIEGVAEGDVDNARTALSGMTDPTIRDTGNNFVNAMLATSVEHVDDDVYTYPGADIQNNEGKIGAYKGMLQLIPEVDPLRAEANRLFELSLAEAASEADPGSPQGQAIAQHITDPVLRDRALAAAYNIEAQQKLKEESWELSKEIDAEENELWSELYDGSANFADSINSTLEDYNEAHAADTDPKRPALRDFIDDHAKPIYGVGTSREILDLVPDTQLRAAGKKLLDARLTEEILADFNNSTDPIEGSAEAERRLADIADEEQRNAAANALDALQAKEAVEAYSSSDVEKEARVSALLESVENPETQQLAQAANGGAYTASRQLDGLAYDLTSDVELTEALAYFGVHNGSNVQARLINDSAAEYMARQ